MNGNGTREQSIASNKESRSDSATLLGIVHKVLEDGKAEEVVTIDLAGKTTIGDYMVIANGRSQRQVGALAENLVLAIKHAGFGTPAVEGRGQCDWVLLDAGDVIVHLFRPEVRAFYNLEKMWAVALPEGDRNAALGA